MYLLATIVVAVLVTLGILKSRGINLSPVLQTVEGALTVADDVTSDASLIGKIIHFAHIAVSAVEQMYQSGQLDGDKRKETAVQFVENLLSASGLDPDALGKLYTVIDITIEAAVSLLKPTQHPAPPTDPAPQS
jgi:hypothetical protein